MTESRNESSALPEIVFVDDEENVLASLQRKLRRKRGHWNMRFFSDPLIALEDMEEYPAQVAVLDIRMPELDGLELARKLRGAGAAQRCIILSGSADFSTVVDSLNAGNVFRYYLKPSSPEELARGIDDALDEIGRTTQAPVESEIFDVLGIALVVVGTDGRLLSASAAGRQYLSNGTVLKTDSEMNCRAVHRRGNEQLDKVCEQALQSDEPLALSLTSEDESEILHIVVVGASSDEKLFMFLSDETAFPQPDPKLLVQMFGLSRSEAQLTAGLAAGLSLDEAAEDSGFTKNTARTYLKSTFSKVGVTRQAELVRKVLTTVGHF